MAETPIIQILEKDDYTKQYIVHLPESAASDALPSSCILVKSSLLGLTTANLAYARLGRLLNWWDVHPLPASTPPEFRDAERYGRISAWGYADVIASTVDAAPVGHRVFGYLPIGTLPVLLRVQPALGGRHLVEVSEHRKNVLSIYNRYVVTEPRPDGARETDGEAYDALMKGLWETCYLLNRLTFAWEPEKLTTPWPAAPGGDAPWDAAQADLKGAIVYVLSASSKTALAFGYVMKNLRPEHERPEKIIAVTSAGSMDFVEGTGFFEEVVGYDEATKGVESGKGVAKEKKYVLCDFGARDEFMDRFVPLVEQNAKSMVWVGVGSDAGVVSSEVALGHMMKSAPRGRYQSNMSPNRDVAMKQEGEEKYWERMEPAWAKFKADGGIPGLRMERRKGMDGVAAAWERLYRQDFKVDEALLIDLGSSDY